MHWWCGRCKSRVDYSVRKCECKGPPYVSPWWRVPDTLWEKIRCWTGTCRYKGTCSICDADHYRNHRDV